LSAALDGSATDGIGIRGSALTPSFRVMESSTARLAGDTTRRDLSGVLRSSTADIITIASPAITALGVRDITTGCHTTMEMECATEHGQRRGLTPLVAEARPMDLAEAAFRVADSTAAEVSTVKCDRTQMLTNAGGGTQCPPLFLAV
jgi:hypothetical protein